LREHVDLALELALFGARLVEGDAQVVEGAG
jgi:hypothetical protein